MVPPPDDIIQDTSHCQFLASLAPFNNWSYARYTADALHVISIFFGIAAPAYNESLDGMSLRTALLLVANAISHWCLWPTCANMFSEYQNFFNGVCVILPLAMIWPWYLHGYYGATSYELEKDAFPAFWVVWPSTKVMFIMGGYTNYSDLMWHVITLIDNVVPLPQLTVTYYRSSAGIFDSVLVRCYVLTLLGSNALHGASDIFDVLRDIASPEAKVFDMSGFAFSVLAVSLFVDYVVLLRTRKSFFRAWLLAFTDIFNDVNAAAETVAGCRLDCIAEWFLHFGEREPRPVPRWEPGRSQTAMAPQQLEVELQTPPGCSQRALGQKHNYNRCLARHFLEELITTKPGYVCSCCGGMVPSGDSTWRCRICDYDQCGLCREELRKTGAKEISIL